MQKESQINLLLSNINEKKKMLAKSKDWKKIEKYNLSIA